MHPSSLNFLVHSAREKRGNELILPASARRAAVAWTARGGKCNEEAPGFSEVEVAPPSHHPSGLTLLPLHQSGVTWPKPPAAAGELHESEIYENV